MGRVGPTALLLCAEVDRPACIQNDYVHSADILHDDLVFTLAHDPKMYQRPWVEVRDGVLTITQHESYLLAAHESGIQTIMFDLWPEKNFPLEQFMETHGLRFPDESIRPEIVEDLFFFAARPSHCRLLDKHAQVQMGFPAPLYLEKHCIVIAHSIGLNRRHYQRLREKKFQLVEELVMENGPLRSINGTVANKRFAKWRHLFVGT